MKRIGVLLAVCVLAATTTASVQAGTTKAGSTKAAFCDGSQITAKDVAFSFTRASAPKAIVSWQYPKGFKVSAPSSSRVVIKLPEANASFLSYLTLWGTGIVSQSYAKKVGDKGL